MRVRSLCATCRVGGWVLWSLLVCPLPCFSHSLEFINREGVTLGVLPEVGGRIVHCSLAGRANLFKESRDLWSEAADQKPGMDFVDGYKAYQGCVVWAGPMSDWWRHQDRYPRKRAAGARWPPDPYLDYGAYAQEGLVGGVRLTSPDSPLSGIRLVKTVTIPGPHRVNLDVEATSLRAQASRFDLWLVARFPGDTRHYVPVRSAAAVEFRGTVRPRPDALRAELHDGYFSLASSPAGPDQPPAYGKAYVGPSKPYLAAFGRDQVLIVVFPETASREVHPEHAPVEVFVKRSPAAAEDLLELEYHSPCRLVSPGEAVRTGQHWWILPYQGEATAAAHTRFLRDREASWLAEAGFGPGR
jgi:hypothetical protein